MFAFLYRKHGNIVLEDLQKARAGLNSPAGTHCWISEARDIGVIWTTGTLLNEQGNEKPLPHQSFALATGRLDVRDTHNQRFNLPPSASDPQRIAACVLQAGEAAPNQLIGDFALAHWTGRALFISTDHLGQTGLYYARTPQGFVVATRLPALLSLPDTPRDLDGLGLALVAMMQGGRGAGHTAFTGIRRLTGGHNLWLEPGRETEERRWWNPEFKIRRAYKDPRDYTAELTTLFDEAVRCRLPEQGPVGCTMSGGLDSTLVAAFAAPMLADTGRDLHAWTSVPHPKIPVKPRPRWDSNDWEYAHQMTTMHQNIQHQAVSPEGICLLDVLQAAHASSATPMHNVANQLWFTTIAHRAREAGCAVVLIGTHGNASISFRGDGAVKRLIRHGKWLQAIAHLRRTPGFRKRSLIRHLLTAIPHKNKPRPFTVACAKLVRPIVQRYYQHRPAAMAPILRRQDWANFISRPKTSFMTDIPAHAGVEIRDPTSDRRLSEYLLSCPEEAFIGGGFDRLQARLLGAGRVPESIRWRRTFGDQSPEQAGFFSLYPERYRNAWEEIRQLAWTKEFIDLPVVDAMVNDLINGQPQEHLLAEGVHRILDIGLFMIDARQRWQASDGF